MIAFRLDHQIRRRDSLEADKQTGFSLRFPAALEAEFREHHLDQSFPAVRVAMLLGIFILAVFGILDFYLVPLAARQIAFIRFGIAIPLVGLGLVMSYTRFYRRIMPVANGALVVVGGLSILAMIVVAERPGRDFYYAGLILVIMFGYTLMRLPFIVATVLGWFLIAVYEYAAIVLQPTPIPILVNNSFFFISANVVGMFAAYMLEFYERRDFLQARQLAAQREEIARERERAEELLYAILPRSVAARLQKHQQVADSFADVTVLFADIVDFSSLTPQLPPGKLVSLLNAVFTGFDALAEKHGLEKVKTIGDAYMAVAGLPAEREDHAEAMAEFALDMLGEIKKHRIGGLEPLNIRIGINTGPVVAGVIGRKKFIYDLWGDTVNLASRMQELGLPGQIHVTNATYQRLRRRYLFDELRHVPIKGAGELSVFTLTGRRPEADTGEAG